ncbi:MAG: hypothetical protein J0J04_04740 [Microbacterium sp.]|uniref:hypothetical protein n=1 Tax=Microbacterium sp. TaxID=51671 RepID=UPI001AD44F8A|nr:hypothetical protein [Microbacterium sp.]MBN9214115.1 hypothetical protein [Microbacterium sp.]
MTDSGNDPLVPILVEDDRFIPEHLIAPEDYWEGGFAPASPAPASVVAEADDEAKVNAAIAKATAGGLVGMSPADRIAALTAIKDAVETRIKWEKSTIIENLLGATSAQSIPTPLGNLSFKPAARPVKFDEDKLLAYVQEHHPDMVTTRTVHEIEPEFRKALLASVIHCGDDDFALGTDGTVIDFAYLGDETAAQIAYPASSAQKQVKAQARRAIDEHFLTLTSGMLDAAKDITL